MTRYLAPLFISLGILVPSFAMAQTAGNSLLSVYVQVTNPYTQYGVATVNPGNFSVNVAGTNVSPSTFYGSQNGVQVSLNPGAYSVNLTGNQYGYTPSYSQGCTGTATAGGTGLCIITVSPNYTQSTYLTPYPYPNSLPPLTCQPANQTAGLRQNVQFTAVGGVGGTYNWQVPGRAYPNVGPVLTVSFDQSGSQLVVVTNATQSATCAVTITQTYTPVVTTNPSYGTTYPNYATTYPNYTYGSNPNPTITPVYYPRLPNTGVEPITVVQIAFALALLGACAAVTAPHVRKAFAIVTR